MTRILVSGLINIETTVRVDSFPVEYRPVRYPFGGVRSTVSGVGYNIAKALHTLGADIRLLSMVGADAMGSLARSTLREEGLSDEFVLDHAAQTAQSAILYDETGRRAILTDLKNIQETAYPATQFERAIEGCSLAVLCNINFSRPFLQIARACGVKIATDVHTISSLDDPYNSDFMQAADILFMSDEALPCPPEEWVRRLRERFSPEVIVIGLGARGALLSVKGDAHNEIYSARQLRPVINTIGAGDALFSAFVHSYAQNPDPCRAIQRAILFASYKIGAAGGAEGFLSGERLDHFYRQIYRE